MLAQLISIRIPKQTLEGLKELASQKGLPYQTHINSILYQHVSEQMKQKQEPQTT